MCWVEWVVFLLCALSRISFTLSHRINFDCIIFLFCTLAHLFRDSLDHLTQVFCSETKNEQKGNNFRNITIPVLFPAWLMVHQPCNVRYRYIRVFSYAFSDISLSSIIILWLLSVHIMWMLNGSVEYNVCELCSII